MCYFIVIFFFGLVSVLLCGVKILNGIYNSVWVSGDWGLVHIPTHMMLSTIDISVSNTYGYQWSLDIHPYI